MPTQESPSILHQMATNPTVVEKEDSAKTMKALQDQFNLSPEVMAAFKSSKVETLTELRFIFASEDEARAYVKAINKITDVNIMVARVRHMWHAPPAGHSPLILQVQD